MTENWIALGGLVFAVSAFFAGLVQYRKAQIWRRLEFAASEAKETLGDERVRFALHLLDWNASCHDLEESTGDPQMKRVPITDSDLARALAPHVGRSDGFDPIEIQIRLAFDEWLGRLQRFEHFIEVGLLSSKDCWPYLRYWLELMLRPTNNGKPMTVVRAIWRYMHYYHYDDVLRLCNRYGFEDLSEEPIAHVV